MGKGLVAAIVLVVLAQVSATPARQATSDPARRTPVTTAQSEAEPTRPPRPQPAPQRRETPPSRALPSDWLQDRATGGM